MTLTVDSFWTKSKLLATLALPMIVSNITIPLVGIVDVAVVGHLSSTEKLAGVSLGALIVTQIIWLCGFLRMSTTGFSAQAKGADDASRSQEILQQALSIALLIGVALILLQAPLFSLGVWLANADAYTHAVAQQYYAIRIWGAPFSLANLVLVGWLLGQQQHKNVMRWQVYCSVLNMLLSYLLAFPADLGVTGVAIATVVSECVLFICCSQSVRACGYQPFKMGTTQNLTFMNMLSSHRHMFLRNLVLQGCLAFISYSGLRLGAEYGAVNAILMQFFVLIALGLDGLAYAIESLIGEAYGKRDSRRLHFWVKLGLFWSTLVAVVYSLVFWLAGDVILSLLTNIVEVRELAAEFMIYIVLLPLLAHWCFLFDGIYIGLGRAKGMRDTMLISALIGLFPVWYIAQPLGNDGLWLSFLVFLLMRGLTMGWHYRLLYKHYKLLA
ncbi:MAG: MATE family efflux transporter [Aestuariibacter sp.]